jgi:hypothetical protein
MNDVDITHEVRPARPAVVIRINSLEVAEAYADLLETRRGDAGFEGDARDIRAAADLLWDETGRAR